MNSPQQDYALVPGKIIAMVCLTIFLSAFAFENFQSLFAEKMTVEIVDAENESEKEQDGEKRDKTSQDKLQSRSHQFDFGVLPISRYSSFIERNLKENIQEIISPPPEV